MTRPANLGHVRILGASTGQSGGKGVRWRLDRRSGMEVRSNAATVVLERPSLLGSAQNRVIQRRPGYDSGGSRGIGRDVRNRGA
jgi:hypothetical protein